MRLPLALFALMLAAAPVLAQQGTVVTGPANAIDADIVMIGDARIILWGLDAPEKRQQCSTSSGRWKCAEPALRRITELTEQGEWTCTEARDPDRFGSLLAVCEVNGINVNSELVKNGLAIAYTDQTDAFAADEAAAKAAKLGLWQDGVTFDMPWAWRGAMTPGGHR